jgi:uncharacterized iron-regulated protein
MRLILAFALLPLTLHAQAIPPAELSDLPPADVVILGEVHDNPVHHTHQATAVAAIAPRALVWEMLTAEQAARITDANRADPGLAQALGWDGSGWPDFAMYQPILTAAPAARVYGAAVPRDTLPGPGTDRAGFADLLPDGPLRAAFLAPLAPADQTAREADQLAAHCDALPADLLPYMVDVQRLRDAALAAAVIEAHADTGGPVVVITGTGHARKDQGIPSVLAAAGFAGRVLSLGQLESDPGPDAPYDLWIITAPHPRPDPCAAFTKGG